MGKQFFVIKENVDVLRLFRAGLRNISAGELGDNSWILKPLLNIVDMMIEEAESFDKYSEANVEWVGSDMIDRMRRFSRYSEGEHAGEIFVIFSIVYQFLCEIEFMAPESFIYAKALEILGDVDERFETIQGLLKKRIVFARYLMPAQITKKFLRDHAINDYYDFNLKVEDASRFMDRWREDFDKQKKDIEELERSAKNIAATFNFVGLVNGFRRLAEEKKNEKKWSLGTLLVLVLLMVAPPIVQISYIFNNMELVASNKGVLLYALPAILAIEVVLIYLFRVVLVQFRSVKAQILQIDLRMSLCQFIQSYADYSIKIKEKDPNALAKFESLVFSGISPDNEGIPSTFDGVEQLANFIKSIRGV